MHGRMFLPQMVSQLCFVCLGSFSITALQMHHFYSDLVSITSAAAVFNMILKTFLLDQAFWHSPDWPVP